MPYVLDQCLDDAVRLWKQRVCLAPVSKDLRGELHLLERELQECKESDCATLKTDHVLKVEVHGHEPCDSELSKLLDGRLVVRRLVHALDGSGERRGMHAGGFRWVGVGAVVEGRLAGMANEGTHREPLFRPCQECHERGVMEGRLCGRVIRASEPRLVGCEVTAAYRIRFDPSEGFQDTGVEGTLEGLVVCPCEHAECIAPSTFAIGSHPNPWTVGGWTFEVHDYTGAVSSSADVVSWGGITGLNAGFECRIDLPAPAATVDITLAHFASPATVTAYAGAAVVDSAVMTVAGTPETLHLTGPGITSLAVSPPQDETLIIEICPS